MTGFEVGAIFSPEWRFFYIFYRSIVFRVRTGNKRVGCKSTGEMRTDDRREITERQAA